MWKWTIRRKLLAGFVVVLIIFGLTIGITYYEFTALQQRYTTLANRRLPDLIATQELRVIIRDIRGSIRSYVLGGDEASVTDFYQAHYRYERVSKQLLDMISVEKEKTLFRQLNELEQQLYQFGQEMMTKKSSTDDSFNIVATKLSDLTKQFEAVSNELAEEQKSDVSTASRSLSTELRAFETRLVMLGIVGGMVGIIISYVISFYLSKRIRHMTEAAQRIARGDLTVEVAAFGRDEIGELAHAFRQMVAHLHAFIEKTTKNAEQVAVSSEQLMASADQTSKAAEQITSAAQDVASGAEKQLQTVQATSHTMQTMSNHIQQLVEQSNNATSLATETSTKAIEGRKTMQTAVGQMHAISEIVQQFSQMVKRLGSRSEQISRIVAIITDIAAQTNLLALNAAIEAARAGEHGRGFAVVAGEVRKLAEQSGRSAEQISSLIAAIQQEMNEAIDAMKQVTEEITAGTSAIEQSEQYFTHTQRYIGDVARQMEDVSRIVQHMAADGDRVVRAMRSVNQIAEAAFSQTQEISAATEQQLAATQQISAASIALATMAEELQQLVQTFRVRAKTISAE